MEFQPVVSDTAKNVAEVVNYILSLEISPEDKKTRIFNVIYTVGEDFYYQMFNANSRVFDSEIFSARSYRELENQIERLAEKLVRNYALTRPINPVVESFYDSALGQAQIQAFRNAISIEQHPTLTRRIVGETCGWCVEMARTFTDPAPEMFSRHEHCDCLFITSGYNTRNGLLTNYKKGKQ